MENAGADGTLPDFLSCGSRNPERAATVESHPCAKGRARMGHPASNWAGLAIGEHTKSGCPHLREKYNFRTKTGNGQKPGTDGTFPISPPISLSAGLTPVPTSHRSA